MQKLGLNLRYSDYIGARNTVNTDRNQQSLANLLSTLNCRLNLLNRDIILDDFTCLD